MSDNYVPKNIFLTGGAGVCFLQNDIIIHHDNFERCPLLLRAVDWINPEDKPADFLPFLFVCVILINVNDWMIEWLNDWMIEWI